MNRRLLAVLAALACAAGVLGLPAAPAAAAPGPSSAPQYWFDDWNVFQLWDAGVRGQGVRIAEIDTGVNAGLPDLTGRVVPGTDLGTSGNGQVDRDRDEFGHGTAMASVMVARPGTFDVTGMAPDAKVLPIAVPLNGTTDAGRPDRLPDAIRYAADHGAKIISMSLGGNRSPRTDTVSCPTDEQSAVFHAMRKGAVVVASVGNTGPTRNTVEEPGVCLGVVSVGAVDAAGTVADFSARQPYLTLVAPGVAVATIGRIQGEAFSGDGTSQAAALTSASMALVWSKYPKLTGRQVVTRVLATLDGRGKPHSNSYGYGALDAYRAVTAKVAIDGPNPVYDAAAPFLARDTELARPAPGVTAPAPVRTRAGGTGHYSVGSAPRFGPQVQLGSGLALGGLVALLLLMVLGLRRRRARAVALAAAWPGGVPPGAWGGPRAYGRPAGPYRDGAPYPYSGGTPYPGAPYRGGGPYPDPGGTPYPQTSYSETSYPASPYAGTPYPSTTYEPSPYPDEQPEPPASERPRPRPRPADD